MSRSIKILFLAANPQDNTRLRLDEEIRAIDQAFREASFRDNFDIEQHWAVRVRDLPGLLLRYQPDIVHFSGHGTTTSEIILENDDGQSQPVPQHVLSGLFSTLKDNIRCVVLNACFSQEQAQAIAKHIDCVVGMSAAVGDDSAVNFAGAFYQALAYGRDVKSAFELGRLRVDVTAVDDSHIPQLLTNGVDPATVSFVNLDVMRDATTRQRPHEPASGAIEKGASPPPQLETATGDSGANKPGPVVITPATLPDPKDGRQRMNPAITVALITGVFGLAAALITAQGDRIIDFLTGAAPTATISSTPPVGASPTTADTATEAPTAVIAEKDMAPPTETTAQETEAAPGAIVEETIGASANGTPISVTRLGNGANHLVLVGGIHAGFAPSSVDLVEFIFTHFRNNPSLIPDSATLHIIPVLNPDSYLPGLDNNVEGRLNGREVDLNRNWDCGWQPGPLRIPGRTEFVETGDHAFSEPETEALRTYIDIYRQNGDVRAVIFWGARADNGQIAVGVCNGERGGSDELANKYRIALSGGYALAEIRQGNGEASDYFAGNRIPSITVLLKEYDKLDDANAHIQAIQSLLNTYGH
jgi:hypothetical protein